MCIRGTRARTRDKERCRGVLSDAAGNPEIMPHAVIPSSNDGWTRYYSTGEREGGFRTVRTLSLKSNSSFLKVIQVSTLYRYLEANDITNKQKKT